MALPLVYNWRNLFVRKLSTTLTFFVVAVVVFVLSVLLSFAEGIRASLNASGSSRNVLVVAQGATAESTSILMPEEVNRVTQTPGVARDAAGNLLLGPEVCVQTSIPRLGPEGALANVGVRGVDPVAFDIHTDVRLIEGRRFDPGALEVIVGVAARQRYAGLELGGELSLGRLANRKFRVVGVFAAGGGALESEIWASRTIMMDVYDRRLVSSVAMRMEEGSATQDAIAYVQGPSVGLQAKTETAYYEELAKKTREIVILATILVGIMAIGAVFAVANTMYAAVDGRKREIAMLRTVGFSRRAVISAFVLESLLVCVPACLLGVAASLLVSGAKQDFLSDATFTVLAYELTVTKGIFALSLGLAIAVAVFGSLAPAVKAARTRVIEALRKA